MKKIILLLITTILLTGCQSTYDIKFTDNKIEDTIKIYTNNSVVQSATTKQTQDFQNELGNWERGYEYYKRELYATEEITGYQYTYSFDYQEYDAMSQLRKCYEDFNFSYENNRVKLTTSNKFLCKTYYKDIDNLTLTITSDYKIINSNANTKSHNTHTWTINKDNYQNMPIEFEIDKTQPYTAPKEEKEIDILGILSCIIFVLLIIVLIVKRKERRRN